MNLLQNQTPERDMLIRTTSTMDILYYLHASTSVPNHASSLLQCKNYQQKLNQAPHVSAFKSRLAKLKKKKIIKMFYSAHALPRNVIAERLLLRM